MSEVRQRRTVLSTAILVSLVWVGSAAAEVVRVEVESRQDVLGGQPFGAAGPYEMITGKVYFAFDPDSPFNARIVDIDKAPRNADGRVEAWANFVVLRPKNQQPGSVALLEVSNRGGKASLAYFNGGSRSILPTDAEHFGDGLLMRLGLTVIWVGWQHDVPLRDGVLRLHVPVATDDGEPIDGLVRADWVVDQLSATLRVGHRNHIAYPLLDPGHPDNVLTVRSGRMEPRTVVPREQWEFITETDEAGVEHLAIRKEGGFEAGTIYELVYRAVEPRVVGLGLAAIRDMMSFAKYDEASPFSVEHGMAIGISQTGRFLRHFVYQGFNTDESGRKVFDGLMIHTAGAGRGSFNHRFAQPSRDAHRYSAFFYPTDIFPFSGRTQTDEQTGWRDGLFAAAHDEEHLPNIFYTNTGYEYWGRAASLLHTNTAGTADVELRPNERVYHLASGQHFVDRFPPLAERALPNARAYRGNPLNFLVTIRALLARMVEWVRDDIEPPASAYPRIDSGSLVAIGAVNFPKVPGVQFPSVIHEAYRAEYGPRWPEGIVDLQPPKLGPAYPSLVSQVDELGNEIAGVRGVEILAPLATYAPWSLRIGSPGGAHELSDFRGTYLPLPRTEAERSQLGDPRPSIESMYAGIDEYLSQVKEAAGSLVGQRFLLPEDVPAVVARTRQHWEWIFEN